MNHDIFIQRCIELASNGIGKVSPNPMVGAVLVYDNKIIGEGWHQKYGESHAEVNCINSVAEENKKYIAESTLYVSLEPCNHFGKTPPCSDLILNSNIKKVVVGCVDANPKVGGSGIKKLVENNVEVIYPVLEKECINLNKRFFTFHEKHRPYIFLKWAQTNDGFIAAQNFKAIKISNEIVNKQIHTIRSQEDAIMVGFNTAYYDNPKLTARLETDVNQPLRIVIDKENKLPKTHFLLADEHKTLILNNEMNAKNGDKEYLKMDFNESLLTNLMNILFERNITSLIVEGGTTLLQSFINENFWDEAIVITNSEMNIGYGIKAPIFQNKNIANNQVIGNNTLTNFKNT
jgi:diaminohydroxyphosphoribosylaminopyrimidine deaminase/5-amino-6-(5-phosphoribosylamino)uracil reductase